MKTFFFSLALALAAASSIAQGTIQLANNAGTRLRVNGAIPVNAGSGGIVGGTFYVGVFVGATADNLSPNPVLPLATNSSIGGLISGPNPQAYQIPGYDPNSTVFIQIRCWESRYGTDWQLAQQEGRFGQTDIRSVVLGPASGPGTVIWSSTDRTKFQAIFWVPEPSTFVLAGLGIGGSLLLRRRQRRRDSSGTNQ